MRHKGKRAVLYARVSTTDQKDNGYSLPQQKEALYKYCKNNDIDVIDYLEEDHTGTTLDRPKIKTLRNIVKSQKIDLILFHKWDRFSRKTAQGLIEIENYKAQGIEANSIIEHIDFNVPQQQMMLFMYLGIGEVENAVRSQRTKSGIRGALKEGRHVNRAPIGYIQGKDPYNNNKPLIKPCPDKSILISEIFKEYATGLYTQEDLRKKYYKLGIVRSKSQFSNLLSNVLYTGRVLVPENGNELCELVPALHDAIITEALFLKVQNVKFGRSNVRLNSKSTSAHDSQLPLRGGILKCAKCGSNLTGSRSKSRNGSYHYYYHCNHKKGCKERFKVSIAHEELENLLISLQPSKASVRLFKAILIDEYHISRADYKKDSNRLKNTLKTLELKLDNLTEKYAEGDVEKNSYIRLKEKYSKDMNEIKLELSEIPSPNKGIENYVNFGLMLLSDLKSYFQKSNTEVKRKLIGSIFSEKLVFENNQYRTTKFSEVVDLIFHSHRDLQDLEHKKGDSISKVSYSVAGTGLEPVTFGL
jgi:site-specific DNA recombinase